MMNRKNGGKIFRKKKKEIVILRYSITGIRKREDGETKTGHLRNE